MNKFSKVIAVALAATMVFGSSLTAFAGDNDGGSTGAGTSEGHVDQKKMNVVLPTMPETGSPFAYTMDPEGLIKETSHAKYGDTTLWPEADADTQVYFDNGVKGGDGADKDKTVYANSSKAQTVTNKSSHAIALTVKAEVSSPADTDIPLVAQSAIASATSPALYLGLIVGDEDAEAISADDAATQTVEVEGTADNFKIAYNSESEKYEYRVLTLDEYKALDGNSSKTQADFDGTWETADFQLEGAVAKKAITDTTTAPSVKVTWSWEDPDAEPEEVAPSTTTTSYKKSETTSDIEVVFDYGSATEITGVKYSADGETWSTYGNPANFYTIDNDNNKLTVKKSFVTGLTATRYWRVYFDDSDTVYVDLTFTAD